MPTAKPSAPASELNHGTLALGRTVPECFMRLYYLERACAIQVKALAGGALRHPPHQSIDAIPSAAMGSLGALAWPALRRMLDRNDRTYQH